MFPLVQSINYKNKIKYEANINAIRKITLITEKHNIIQIRGAYGLIGLGFYRIGLKHDINIYYV